MSSPEPKKSLTGRASPLLANPFCAFKNDQLRYKALIWREVRRGVVAIVGIIFLYLKTKG